MRGKRFSSTRRRRARWPTLAVALSAVLGCAGQVPASPPGPPATSTPAPDAAATARSIRGATRVTFPSRDGDLTHGAPTEIQAWLMRPEGPGPFPAMVLLHGCGGLYTKSGADLTARHHEYAERFAAEGHVVVLPDSFSPRGVEETCSRKDHPVRPFYERNRDAYGALAWLEAQPSRRARAVGAARSTRRWSRRSAALRGWPHLPAGRPQLPAGRALLWGRNLHVLPARPARRGGRDLQVPRRP
jgi:hypothetical protein